ncbi:MAG: metal-dependent hydrolase [Candidatus Diapherotrites archaeon]
MVKIQFLGHSFFRVSFPGINLLIDPYINHNTDDLTFERLIPCVTNTNTFQNISSILITHEHFDHFDQKAIEKFALGNDTKIVAHDSILNQLNLPKNKLHSICRDQTIILDHVEITAKDAHHPRSFYPLGYLISHKGQSVYHAGDTSLIDQFAGIHADITLLPIGGANTMDVVDAVRAVKTMKPKYAVPMHYNTFKTIKADPREFKAKIEKSILKTKPIILKPGESFTMK